MIDIPPIVIWGLMASLAINLFLYEKYTSFDVFYTATTEGKKTNGRMNVSVNSDYINGNIIELKIKSELTELNKNSDVPYNNNIKIIVTGWNKTSVGWRLKKWVTGTFKT